MALLVACLPVFAGTDTKVESSRKVSSADGKKTAVVDRLTPVVDGEPERYSGRMLIRVTSDDGSPAKQRYIEASQARVVQPPVWLNNRVCAFIYNIAKNSNGIVYFEPDTNRALQVEIVMPIRTMASGKEEQELTSFEVTEFTNETLKVNNVPWNGGSAFPLVLGPLPTWQDKPYDITFYNSLNSALQAYKDFLSTNKIKNLDPEQASESFSEDEKWLSLLACNTPDPYLLSLPLHSTATNPATVLSKAKAVKVNGVELSCAHHAASENAEAPMQDSRFLTKWISNDSVQVVKESYSAESDEPIVTPLFTLNVSSGVLKQEAVTPGTQPAAR